MRTPGRVLDVGCDGSILDKYLERRGFKCVCVDIDPEGGLYWSREPRENFVQVDFANLGVHDVTQFFHKFDYVTVISTAEHLNLSDQFGLLLNCALSCDKDGKILITVPYGVGLKMQGQWIVSCFNEEELNKLLAVSGFAVTRSKVVEGIGSLPLIFAVMELKK